MSAGNPIYQCVQRSNDSLWRWTTWSLAAIAALFATIILLWIGAELYLLPGFDLLDWMISLSWMPLVLIPAIPSISAAAFTASHACSDEYTLIRLSNLFPDEIAAGYYKGVRARFEMPMMVLARLAIAAAAGALVFMIIQAIGQSSSIITPMPLLRLPFMLGYIAIMSRQGTALGVLAGLRSRSTATALAVTTAGVLGIPVVLMVVGVVVSGGFLLYLGMPLCLCAASGMTVLFSTEGLHERLLHQAERWV
jgi:hypothetical protein